MSDFPRIPSVEQVLLQEGSQNLVTNFGRSLVVDEIRITLESIRQGIVRGEPVPEIAKIVEKTRKSLEDLEKNSLIPVINATGVILHTNLGRAPLSHSVASAVVAGLTSYSTVEMNLVTGTRQNRNTGLEGLIKRLLNVEASLAVNNNAAAVFLSLRTMAYKKKVIIARNQLVEIGGGFRIPDILQQSGARLMEIGTTNQIRLDDYRRAIDEGGSIVLHVHQANFKITGYTSEPELKDIVKLAHSNGLPVIDDLGSGALLDTSIFGLGHEPTVQESLADGVDVICFSCDKLLGGPQAGIIAGKSEYLSKIKKHPLARVLRTDKSLIAGLEVTLLHYLKGKVESDIPIWQMISTPLDEIRRRAEFWKARLGDGAIIDGQSTVGGGSLPDEILPTQLLALAVKKTDALASLLRTETPAIISRIQDGMICFDPRTVLPEQDDVFIEIITRVLSKYREKYEN